MTGAAGTVVTVLAAIAMLGVGLGSIAFGGPLSTVCTAGNPVLCNPVTVPPANGVVTKGFVNQSVGSLTIFWTDTSYAYSGTPVHPVGNVTWVNVSWGDGVVSGFQHTHSAISHIYAAQGRYTVTDTAFFVSTTTSSPLHCPNQNFCPKGNLTTSVILFSSITLNVQVPGTCQSIPNPPPSCAPPSPVYSLSAQFTYTATNLSVQVAFFVNFTNISIFHVTAIWGDGGRVDSSALITFNSLQTHQYPKAGTYSISFWVNGSVLNSPQPIGDAVAHSVTVAPGTVSSQSTAAPIAPPNISPLAIALAVGGAVILLAFVIGRFKTPWFISAVVGVVGFGFTWLLGSIFGW